MVFSVSPDGWYDFAGVLLVIALAVLQSRVGRSGAFWQVCWAFPGTFLHESAHFVVAAVTGARPVGFSVIPRRDTSSPEQKRWLLGSVRIANPGVLSSFPSGLAPLMLNGVACYLFLNWWRWFPPDLLHVLLRYAAVYLFSYSSIPSGKDLEVAFSRPAGVAIYGGAAMLVWSWLR